MMMDVQRPQRRPQRRRQQERMSVFVALFVFVVIMTTVRGDDFDDDMRAALRRNNIRGAAVAYYDKVRLWKSNHSRSFASNNLTL